MKNEANKALDSCINACARGTLIQEHGFLLNTWQRVHKVQCTNVKNAFQSPRRFSKQKNDSKLFDSSSHHGSYSKEFEKILTGRVCNPNNLTLAHRRISRIILYVLLQNFISSYTQFQNKKAGVCLHALLLFEMLTLPLVENPTMWNWAVAVRWR